MNEEFQNAIDAAAAYTDVALEALDREDVGVARAAMRRVAESLLRIPRWDGVNGGTFSGEIPEGGISNAE